MISDHAKRQYGIESLQEYIDYQLGLDIMKKIKYLQNVESMNCVMDLTAPKNRQHTGNVGRCLHRSALQTVNDGLASSRSHQHVTREVLS